MYQNAFLEIKKYGYFPIALACFTALNCSVFNHADSTLGDKTFHVGFIIVKLLFLSLSFFFFLNRNEKKSSKWIYYLMPFLISEIVMGGFSFIGVLGIALFAFANNKEKYNCFWLFRSILVITSLLGIIGYIAYIVKLPIPYTTTPLYNSVDGYYINYGFTILTFDYTSLRLDGFFNEPGYFGTILALTLIADNLNYRRKSNIVMLLGGIFTLSLAFFIIIGMFLLINNIGRFTRLIGLLLSISLLFLLLSKTGLFSDAAIEKTLDRFVLEDGRLVGDNRSSSYLDNAYDKVISDPNLWVSGYGERENLSVENTLSGKSLVVLYGIGGTLFMLGSLLFCIIKTNKMSWYKWCFVICFFSSIYQRPSVFNLHYFLILFGGLVYIDQMEKNKVYET